MSLFGHHHAAPTVISRISDASVGLLHLPLAVWLTLIPIAGGLVIAYVTHRLNLRRDRMTVRREDERRRAEDERTATRVRADLSLRLARHREALRAAARGDLARLETEHAALRRRAVKADVIDVLGAAYLPFMTVLQREETLLAVLGATESHGLAASEQRRALDDLDSAFASYAEQFALTASAPPIKIAR